MNSSSYKPPETISLLSGLKAKLRTGELNIYINYIWKILTHDLEESLNICPSQHPRVL